jgi:hypothetical protein
MSSAETAKNSAELTDVIRASFFASGLPSKPLASSLFRRLFSSAPKGPTSTYEEFRTKKKPLNLRGFPVAEFRCRIIP